MRLNLCLFLNSLVFAADLKLSGWVSCSNWACNEAIQEGVARLNFIGLKSDDDIDWLKVQSGDTIVVTGKDAGTLKGVPLLHGHVKGKENEKGSGLFPSSVLRVLRDKLRPLNSRRYFEDIQNEKRGIESDAADDTKTASPPQATRAPTLSTEAPRVDFKLMPLQKTSQIWTWIDNMLDDRFVDRLLLTLKDEQSALLLLVSSRMATQKSLDKPELQRFHQLAKEVSTSVESAHGIGKRRESRTPPTLSELSELAHRVSQLLLDPYAATMYQNSKGFQPPKLHEVRVKYGIASDEDIDLVRTEKLEENKIPDEDVNNTESVETVEDNLENLEGSQSNEEKHNAEQATGEDPNAEEATADNVDKEEQVKPSPEEDSPPSDENIKIEPEESPEELTEDVPPLKEDEQAPVKIVPFEEDTEEVLEEPVPDIEVVDNLEEELEAQLEGEQPVIDEIDMKQDADSGIPEVHAGNDILNEDVEIVENVIENQQNDIAEEEIDLSLPEDTQEDIQAEPTEAGINIEIDTEPEEEHQTLEVQEDNAKIDDVVDEVSDEIEEIHHQDENAEMQEETVELNDEIREDSNEIHFEDKSTQETINIDDNELQNDLETDLKQEDGNIAREEDLPVDANFEEINKDDTLEVDIQDDMTKEFAEADIVENVAEETEPVIETNDNLDSPENEIESREIVIDPSHDSPDDVLPVEQDNEVAESTDERGSASLNGASSSLNELVDDSILPESDSFEVNPDISNEVEVDESLDGIANPLQEEDTPEPTMESTTPFPREINPHRERELLRMLESKPLLFKITNWINIMGEETFSEFWLVYFLLSFFFFSSIRRLATICSDGGISAKIAILDKELASKKAENIAKQEKVEKAEIDRAQAELNTTRHEIKGIEEKLSALRKFESQFDQYLQQLNDSAIEMTQKTEELRAQDVKFTMEMESESGKYTELQKFSSQDLQAIEDINAHEADLKNKTESMLSKNQNMVKEIPKLEADLKKAKLVNQNFVQELEELKSSSRHHKESMASLSEMKNASDEKLTNVQQNIFDQKVVYTWLEANADCAGDSAEEIILNQRSYLVNAIKRIPKQKSENKRLLQENEELNNRLENLRASCADLDKKIDAVETSEELEAQFTELKEEVETLQAKLEVTNDYYAKRETEINAQLGTESAERDNFESSYQSQKERESHVKEQLDILKDQCADLESKWEDADVKYNKMLAELEERKTSNFLALTDTEMKVVQLTQVVRSLRNDTNEIDDRIEQAQEYMNELEVKLDESSRSDRRSDTGSDLGSMSRSIGSHSHASTRPDSRRSNRSNRPINSGR